MAKRPILFSGDMVKAILEGRKTQTRRVTKPQAEDVAKDDVLIGGRWKPIKSNCPYGKVGDRAVAQTITSVDDKKLAIDEHQRKPVRLPSSLCKPSLRTYFDWDDTGNEDYAARPTLLDLFSGAGGAAFGYYLAGFRVVGVDINPQPHYPFEFHQADALAYPLEGFDAYHASPPCQAYSIMKNLPWVKNKKHPKLIEPVRELLKATNKPYAIENVMGAKLNAGWLCGQMFGLDCYRHRAFLTNFFWMQPGHPNHRMVIESGGMLGGRASKAHDSLRLDWMTKKEQSQAIPPAYTEYIGRFLYQAIKDLEEAE